MDFSKQVWIDGGDDRGLPAFNEYHIDINLPPSAMDTSTLIEWIERQLESPYATELRSTLRKERHKKWHQENYGIFACCIKVTTLSGEAYDL